VQHARKKRRKSQQAKIYLFQKRNKYHFLSSNYNNFDNLICSKRRKHQLREGGRVPRVRLRPAAAAAGPRAARFACGGPRETASGLPTRDLNARTNQTTRGNDTNRRTRRARIDKKILNMKRSFWHDASPSCTTDRVDPVAGAARWGAECVGMHSRALHRRRRAVDKVCGRRARCFCHGDS
jgi:hypothetical protein